MGGTVAIDGYIRVSDVGGREGDRYASPSLQRKAIEDAAKRIGERLCEVVTEEDVSGAKRAEHRGLGYLIERCERGESSGIIVSNIDRLSRGSLKESAEIYERLDQVGARLIAALEGVDSHAPGAELTFGMLALIARQQWRRIQRSWKSARSRAIDRGAYPTKTPWGYDRDEDGRLVPNEGLAPIIRDLFARRARGATISDLAAFLADVPPPTSERASGSWSHSTIAQVLRNPAYTGEARHGEFLNENADPAILSRAEFDAVQVARPIRTPKGDPRSNEALVAGIARCAGCGHTLKIVQGYGGKLRYYCKGPYSSGTCPARCLIRVDELDPYVEDWFLAAIRDEVRIAKAVEANGKLDTAQQALELAEARLAAYVETADTLDRKLYLRGLEARQRTVELAKLDLAELHSRASLLGDAPSGDLVATWPDLSVVEKRRLIAALVDGIRVSKGDGDAVGRVQLVRDDVVIAPRKRRMALAK
jgi:site-specific DNA recombinase